MPNKAIQQKLLDAALRDIDELLPQLEPRAEELAQVAIQRLRERGEQEERDLREILERQRKRVVEEIAKYKEKYEQLALDLNDEDRRQLEMNMRYWPTRLQQFDRDLEHEPQRVRDFYEIRAQRVEPIGLVYLWPETN